MHESQEPIALACNPQALSAQGWASHQALVAQLFGQVSTERHELADGFAFTFPVAALCEVASFIEGERRCCPFFSFELEVGPAATSLTLRITGAPMAKAILAEGLAAR